MYSDYEKKVYLETMEEERDASIPEDWDQTWERLFGSGKEERPISEK